MAAGAVNTARQLGFALRHRGAGQCVRRPGAGHACPTTACRRRPRLARAVAGGQSRFLLHATPEPARPGFDHALHAAAVAGVQGTLAVSGAVGLLAGAIVLILMRPAKKGAPVRPSDGRDGSAPELTAV